MIRTATGFRLGKLPIWTPVTSNAGQMIYAEAVNYWLANSPTVDILLGD